MLLALSGGYLYSQSSSWIVDRSIKTVESIGRGVLRYDKNNSEILYDPLSDNNVKVDTSRLVNGEIVEFKESFRNALLPVLGSSSYRIANVSLVNPVEYIMSYNSIVDMPNDEFFIYSGQSADSVFVTIARKKELNVDIDQSISSIATTLGINIPNLTDAVLGEDASYEKNDSVYYRLNMSDDNALFRVQVLKKKSTRFDASKVWLHFPTDPVNKDNISDTIKLTYASPLSSTEPESPRFGWRVKSSNKVEFSLTVDKSASGELKLGIRSKEGSKNQVLWLESKSDVNNRIFWSDNLLVYTYKGNKKIRKYVYLNIYAEKLNEDSVRIIQRAVNDGITRRVTYITYPEVKIKYMRKG